MERATKVARIALRASAAILLILGVVIWTGHDGPIPVHAVLGFVLVGSLWTICFAAARSGEPTRLVAPAVVWGLIAAVFGMAHDKILAGNLHWTIQILHVVVSMGAVGLGERLMRQMRKQRAGATAVASGWSG